MPTPRANVGPCGVTMRPFQKQITDWCAHPQSGLVRVVYYNRNETIGKSVLAKYLEYHNLATIVYPTIVTRLWDFVKFGVSHDNGQSLVIVLPQKFLSCSERLELWNKIKVVGDEYANVPNIASPLQIIIFTHVMPHFSFLTSDFWKAYEVLTEYVLREILIDSWPQESRTPHGAFSGWDPMRPFTEELQLERDRMIYLYTFSQEEHALVWPDYWTGRGQTEECPPNRPHNIRPVGTRRTILGATLEDNRLNML